MRPTDPLYGNQWHLAQIGGLETVWDYYTGRNVDVVIYDDGVEGSHPDLNDNYSPAGAFTYLGTTYTSAPTSTYGHGTSVAGLIAAEAFNGQGGVGVAWNATVASLNFLDEVQLQPDNVVLAALNNAAKFDVMNCSWGYEPYYDPYQSLAQAGSWINDVNSVFSNISANGRGGLGTIIVQSAGNEFLNVNGDGMHASRFTIAVGATDRYGDITDYSNRGASILVVAPDAAYTTDLTGNAGFNSTGTLDGDPLTNTSYTSVFGGTSASAPLVSGVVALMLEANPNLGWRDVHNILALSASHTGSALNAGPSAAFELFPWEVANSGAWNGGGIGYNPDYGFGMVDALAAVGMAEVWTVMHGSPQTSANEASTSASFNGSVAINNNSSAFAQVTVGQNIDVETVMVTVGLTHSYSPDLELTLIAPDGSEYFLMADGSAMADMSLGFTWTFGVEGARGLSSIGTWQLRVDDNAAYDAGVITSFKVDIYGATPTGYDVHTFTDDFLMYAAQDASRRDIISTNASDWLNFAGVTGNISAVLAPNRTITVNGQYWAKLNASSDFRKLATGSGDDIVHSGAGVKQIRLGLGDDELTVGNAVGRFSGGRGFDRIDYFNAPGGVSVDLATNAVSGSWASDDVIDGFEHVTGSGLGNDTLYGSGLANNLRGEGGDDIIFGRDGSDWIAGGGGNDTIYGGARYDTIYAGAGDDSVFGDNGRDTVYLGSGNDVFNDSPQNDQHGGDTVFGGGGRDTINGSGGGGDDLFNGEDGEDLISGGLGADTIYGGKQYDTIYGGDGNDVVDGGDGRDLVYLGDGDDIYIDNSQSDIHGRDTVIGGNGDDTIHGGGGDDIFDGGNGNDWIAGGYGNDTIYGGLHFDTIYAGGGNDVVYGGDGRDEIWLGSGNDVFFDTIQNTVQGSDTVNGGDGNDKINGGGGDDIFNGDSGADWIAGGDGNDTINGGTGYDTIYGGNGNDIVNGGDGRDTVHLGGGDDQYTDTAQNDGNARDIVFGMGGNDTIDGGGGDDWLNGGADSDVLTGGVGADSFVFLAGYGQDLITDFTDNVDTLVLDDALWGGGLSVDQVIATYGSVAGGNTVFNFGSGDIVTLTGIASLGLLNDDISIV
ncbi:S8 family serine peptidase [Defluviimonas sp. SAOS-178_SWC]|uniref:S8 family serine peptidase n=1 Tax=Defluviimonas sp. SAOS-178_SWC TaxID=3121287 RepID=UPI0032215246